MTKGLEGLRVVTFESRLSGTLKSLLELQGAEVTPAPSMKEVPLEENKSIPEFGVKLFSGEIDVLILLTGVGTRVLMQILETQYPKEKILGELKKIQIIPRGPKPIRVLKELGVPYALTVPEPNTWRDLLQTLDANAATVPVSGRRVALQEYGVSNEPLIAALKDRGAKLSIVPVYRWVLPDDLGPLQEAIRKICDGGADVALFTTSVQVDHVLQVAKTMGLEEGLRSHLKRMVMASVGPDCSETMRALRLDVDIEPESPKMGPLVTLTAEKAKQILALKNNVSGSKQSEGQRGLTPLAPVFLAACRLEKTPYTPVWLMRQAGRYMREYQRIREKVGFLELCKTPQLAAQVTVEAQQKINADAAILFSDILVLLECFGVGLEYVKGDGPLIRRPLRSQADIDKMSEAAPGQTLSFVFETLRLVKKELKPGVALIGFAGAPFTLASYLIEGGSSQNFRRTRTFMKKNKKAWAALMEKLAGATAEYLNAQIHAGADAVQLFDSWVGYLDEAEYKQYAMPYTRMVFQKLDKKAPAIHFGTGTGMFLETFAAAGGDVIGVDHHMKLGVAWKRIGYDKAIQGNLAPFILVKKPKEMKKFVQAVLEQAAGRPGHIFNLGHGVMPETKVEHVIELIQMVHELSKR